MVLFVVVEVAVVAVVCFFIGSINPATLLARARGQDLRASGSGNPGATNAGRVLSRTMIVEHVWDQSFEGLTNIVDVYVRQLRAKIDEPFDRKLIHTVRSVGYVINENGME